MAIPAISIAQLLAGFFSAAAFGMIGITISHITRAITIGITPLAPQRLMRVGRITAWPRMVGMAAAITTELPRGNHDRTPRF